MNASSIQSPMMMFLVLARKRCKQIRAAELWTEIRRQSHWQPFPSRFVPIYRVLAWLIRYKYNAHHQPEGDRGENERAGANRGIDQDAWLQEDLLLAKISDAEEAMKEEPPANVYSFQS